MKRSLMISALLFTLPATASANRLYQQHTTNPCDITTNTFTNLTNQLKQHGINTVYTTSTLPPVLANGAHNFIYYQLDKTAPTQGLIQLVVGKPITTSTTAKAKRKTFTLFKKNPTLLSRATNASDLFHTNLRSMKTNGMIKGLTCSSLTYYPKHRTLGTGSLGTWTSDSFDHYQTTCTFQFGTCPSSH